MSVWRSEVMKGSGQACLESNFPTEPSCWPKLAFLSSKIKLLRVEISIK